MKFQVVTGSPVRKVIGPLCQEICDRTDNAITSGFRGDEAESLLKRPE